ncbi:MAG: ATP-binding cassette domain-containing protein [Nitriliruptor sp.]|nr:MAG: ATP-binding cassette domain-containing protein [Nitriliruptor sp.]
MSLEVDVRARVGEFGLRADFRLPPGLTVLFGPSGSGKTRLLRLLAGLDRPEAGRVGLDGEVFDEVVARVHVAPHERRIGMVFQEPYLLPHRSVLANVALAVREGDRPERRARAEALLAQVDATPFAQRRPAQLSGGQRQRVALARAMAGEPRLLLLDEPFNALDVPVRLLLRRLVRELVDRAGVPTLFVTHDLDELRFLADHVLLADDGDITTLTDVATAVDRLDGRRGTTRE